MSHHLNGYRATPGSDPSRNGADIVSDGKTCFTPCFSWRPRRCCLHWAVGPHSTNASWPLCHQHRVSLWRASLASQDQCKHTMHHRRHQNQTEPGRRHVVGCGIRWRPVWNPNSIKYLDMWPKYLGMWLIDFCIIFIWADIYLYTQYILCAELWSTSFICIYSFFNSIWFIAIRTSIVLLANVKHLEMLCQDARGHGPTRCLSHSTVTH